MSTFKLPKCVAKELDRLQTTFLWGDSEIKRKIHLVKWREVIMNLKQRGVGIRDTRFANQSLLVKWWWRFALQDDSLWKQLICNKYGLVGGRCMPSFSTSANTSTVWRDILNMVLSNTRLQSFFEENVEITIGNDCRI
ncbi:hypothetical protein ACSBR2_041095 [Camellia fascicularis]